MKPRIKPIETKYSGCRFRSRTEARWAVFFNRLNVAWEYEKQGYDFGFGERYLPDFFLKYRNYAGGLWMEVKGLPPNEGELRKLSALTGTGHAAILVVGAPGTFEIFIAPSSGAKPYKGTKLNYRAFFDQLSRLETIEDFDIDFIIKCAVESAKGARFDGMDDT